VRSISVQPLLWALLLAGGFHAEARAQAGAKKKNATVFLGSLNQTYTGFARSATATTTPPGLSGLKFTYDGSPVAPTAAGRYTVSCTLVNDKYQGSATGTLVIAKATAIVTLGNLSQTFSGSPRQAMATTSAVGVNINLTYNGSPVAPTAPGTYPVVAKVANSNYEGSATGALVIGKANSMIALAMSPAKAMVGQKITLTAMVTPTLNGMAPTGSVQFKDGDKVIGTGNLTNNNGAAMATFSLTLTAGDHAFTGAYAGDTNFAANTSPRAR
jgi:hypothetical protein